MMMGLKQPLEAGPSVPLTIEFQVADGSASTVEVKAIAGFAPPTP